MAVSPNFRDFVLEQLQRALPAIRSRRMFGGVGVYSENLFFALMTGETLYFKVDDTNRADYDARGLGPWRPFGGDKASMQYYEVGMDILEDVDALRPWAEKAVQVARLARGRKRK